MLKIKKNLLDKKILDSFKQSILHRNFPWNYSNINNEDSDLNIGHQFVHVFYYTSHLPSSYFYLLDPILKIIKPKAMVRAKVNFNWRTDKQVVAGLHHDTDAKCKTSVFYLNTNNGGTKFEDGTFIKSDENTLITFSSTMLHSGVTNTCDQPFRLVLNLNYYDE